MYIEVSNTMLFFYLNNNNNRYFYGKNNNYFKRKIKTKFTISYDCVNDIMTYCILIKKIVSEDFKNTMQSFLYKMFLYCSISNFSNFQGSYV